MSYSGSDKPHLFEDDLTDRANTEREVLAKWASSASFTRKADDFEIHESEELDLKLTPLLKELDLLGKGYSLVQIPGPKYAPFHHGKGDALLIPIQILDGSPNASGKPLREGKRLYMKANHEVKIEPKLRLLFVLL